MRAVVLGLALAVMGLGSGCASARYVHQAGEEGIVAIPDSSDSWPGYNMTNAKKLIESHVGPAYDILEQKEVVVGNVTQNHQNTNRDTAVNPFVPFLSAEQQVTTTTTTTNQVKEWQIHYRKRVGLQVGTGFGGPGPLGGIQQAGATSPMMGQARPAPGGVELPSVMPAGGVPQTNAPTAGMPHLNAPKPNVTITGN